MQGWTFVFDLDGTLIDTAPDLIRATNYIMQAEGLAPHPPATLRPTISFGARKLIIRGLEMHGHTRSRADIDALLARFLDYYADNIAVESRPFEALVDTLETLARSGARLAVCTNKVERLSRILLAQLRLDTHFAAITGRDTFPVCKPDPAHLTGAIEMAGGDRDRAIMIGDSEVDITTAKAAGIPVVAVTFGYPATPVEDLAPDAIIGHYGELEDVARRLIARGAAGNAT